MSSLTFLGAARTVTGSKHLLDAGGHRVLVDCGLFQGLKELRERNWQPLPIREDSINAVVLTHAHLDHCGYLPKIVQRGFKGPIYCTPATAELAKVVLEDAAKLQEEDAERANRKKYTKHSPALPLFTVEDAARAIRRFETIPYERPKEILPGLSVEYINAGHLLGSAFARVHGAAVGKTILFGGDLGRFNRPVLPNPSMVPEADVVLVESTYGDRLHERGDDGERMASIIRRTVERGGRVIIPAFALGRVEELLYWLHKLEKTRRIRPLPVYVDSPMAASVLETYRHRLNELDAEMSEEKTGAHSFNEDERDLCVFCTRHLKVIASIKESRAVQESRELCVVISASGMATGGRVLHHLARALPDARNTILFAGYQAVGTRGRQLKDGAKFTKIHGQDVPVAAEIAAIDSMSAHADQQEILTWLGGFNEPPSLTCLVHGEPAPMDTLKSRIEHELKWTVRTPGHQETIAL
jgi:metallo-beta-lactamase family protein